MASRERIAYTCDTEASGNSSAIHAMEKQTSVICTTNMGISSENNNKPMRKNKRKSTEPRKAVRLESFPVKRRKEDDQLGEDGYDVFGDDMCDDYENYAERDHSTSVLRMDDDVHEGHISPDSGKPTRSYKSLSRARRIVANARERNRVHTISAAFEGLRKAVPSYSHNQKLSKLAILRIACSYILALARLADLDYTQERDGMTFAECVEQCTNTLQAEGRSRRRKEI
ncbi:uncharacterized protein LOC100377132 [Saccoglossus kowalevskii]|uniref:Neurogenic differentiation factor 1-like n=1 Tax=Saccoglossus kowalevskii TaxID=10224 RepID=A0ABM0GTR0_SACKO|nr:PREDICTED: neurogenic differentiation factor 1-like [Saccoglossus kowalevskii]